MPCQAFPKPAVPSLHAIGWAAGAGVAELIGFAALALTGIALVSLA